MTHAGAQATTGQVSGRHHALTAPDTRDRPPPRTGSVMPRVLELEAEENLRYTDSIFIYSFDILFIMDTSALILTF